jgi:hypothetical protein
MREPLQSSARSREETGKGGLTNLGNMYSSFVRRGVKAACFHTMALNRAYLSLKSMQFGEPTEVRLVGSDYECSRKPSSRRSAGSRCNV